MAGLAGDVPAFDGLWNSDETKDTRITIIEEDSLGAADQAGAGHKGDNPDTAGNRITLEAHWVVLFSLSTYFQTKLERWSGKTAVCKEPRQQTKAAAGPQQQQQQQHKEQKQGQQEQQVKEEGDDCKQQQDQLQEQEQELSPYQYTLQLLVPPGQLELGRRLITAMYSSSPDLSDLEAPQLMQLAALAECYGVGKVVTAAAAQLHKLDVQSMPLEIAAAVFELPEACLMLPAFKRVLETAADKLQQELGDLEVMWADSDKRAALRALPFEALLQLLGDERTRVACGREDTAVATAAHWVSTNPEAVSKAPQLLGVLRLPHCTSTYLTSSYVREELAKMGVSADQLYDLAALSALTSEQRMSWLQRSYQPDAWQLPRRPAPAVDRLQWDYNLKLADVKGAFEAAVAVGNVHYVMTSLYHVWHGRWWDCGVYVTAEGTFGVCLDPGLHRACCDFTIKVLPPEHAEGYAWTAKGVFVDNSLRARWYGLLCKGNEEGAPATWAALRGELDERGMVHPDDTLHFTCTVTAVA